MPVKEKIYINVENPFTLNDTDSFWMVLSGEVNVFYTKVDETGNYLIPLKHFYTVQKGEILFSLRTENDNENTRLIAFSMMQNFWR
jgi:ATP-binding cassette subfamily C protein